MRPMPARAATNNPAASPFSPFSPLRWPTVRKWHRLPPRAVLTLELIALLLIVLFGWHLAEAVGTLGTASFLPSPPLSPTLRGEVELAATCLRRAFEKHDRGVGAKPKVTTDGHAAVDPQPRPFAAPQFSVPAFVSVCAGKASCVNVLPQLLDAFCEPPHHSLPPGHHHGAARMDSARATEQTPAEHPEIQPAVGASRVVVVMHGPPTRDVEGLEAAFAALATALPKSRFAVVRVPREMSCSEWFNAMLRAAFAGRSAVVGDGWHAGKAAAAVKHDANLAVLSHGGRVPSAAEWAGVPHAASVAHDAAFLFKAEAVPRPGHLAAFARFAAAHDDDKSAGWLLDGFSAFGLRRAAFAQIGFFDEAIYPASGEDDEYQMRAASLGLQFHDYNEEAVRDADKVFRDRIKKARRASWALVATSTGGTPQPVPPPLAPAWSALVPTVAYGASSYQPHQQWPASDIRCCAYAPTGEAMRRLDKVDYLWRKWGVELRGTNAVASHRYRDVGGNGGTLYAHPWNLTDVPHHASWGNDPLHRRCTLTGDGPRLKVKPAALRFVKGECLYSECEACLFDYAGVLPRLRSPAHRSDPLPAWLTASTRQRY